MRFKLDENLPEILVSALASRGHEAATCREEGLAGGGDQAIASHAASEGRILMTFDVDFSDIRRYPPATHAGMII